MCPGATRSFPGSRPPPIPFAVSELTFIYGRNPLREALRGRRRVHQAWILEGRSAAALAREVEHWGRGAGVPAPRVTAESAADLTARAGSQDHQGVVAEVDPYSYVADETLLAQCDLIVALDRVQDPHNLGAIIRTAEGAGAGVVIPRHRAAGVTAAVVKASAGATEHAWVTQTRNLTEFIELAKKRGFWVYGAEAGAGQAYDDQDYSGRAVFVLGSEGAGLGRRVAQACDVLVCVPQWGKVGSLNVSVTGGVLLFEARRQRRASQPPGGPL